MLRDRVSKAGGPVLEPLDLSRGHRGWAYRNGVALDFIRPGRPVENCFIESFSGRLRDECLNVEVFPSCAEFSPTLLTQLLASRN
jgi:transposase InsO family protein